MRSAIFQSFPLRTVRLWSPTAHHLLHTLSHTAPVSSLHLSNVLLITASLSGDILLWNVTSGTLLLEMSKAGEASMMSLSLASHRLYGAGRYINFVCLYTCTCTVKPVYSDHLISIPELGSKVSIACVLGYLSVTAIVVLPWLYGCYCVVFLPCI